MHYKSQSSNKPNLKGIRNFCKDNPEFSIGGMRHALFYKIQELENNNAICRFGSRIFINEEIFLQLVTDGFFRSISGRSNTDKDKSANKTIFEVNYDN